MEKTKIAKEDRICHKVQRIGNAVCTVGLFQTIILLQLLLRHGAETDGVLEVLDIGVSYIWGYMLIGETCTKIVSEFIGSFCYTHYVIYLWQKGNVWRYLHYTLPVDRVPFILSGYCIKNFGNTKCCSYQVATGLKGYLSNSS